MRCYGTPCIPASSIFTQATLTKVRSSIKQSNYLQVKSLQIRLSTTGITLVILHSNPHRWKWTHCWPAVLNKKHANNAPMHSWSGNQTRKWQSPHRTLGRSSWMKVGVRRRWPDRASACCVCACSSLYSCFFMCSHASQIGADLLLHPLNDSLLTLDKLQSHLPHTHTT